MQPNDSGLAPTLYATQRTSDLSESGNRIGNIREVVSDASATAIHNRYLSRPLDTRNSLVSDDSAPRITSDAAQSSVREAMSMVPYQTWEGYVTSVIPEEHRFTADLHDKAGLCPSYTADISLTEVNAEDVDLVREGAVFYWTFGKVNQNKANSFNFDQIRFRRLPNWSKLRLDKATKQGDELFEFFSDIP